MMRMNGKNISKVIEKQAVLVAFHYDLKVVVHLNCCYAKDPTKKPVFANRKEWQSGNTLFEHLISAVV